MTVTGFKKASSKAGFRVPPQNIEAEQNLLGGLLIDDAALTRVIELVQPDDFYKDAHNIIYSAVLQLFDRNEPRDRSYSGEDDAVSAHNFYVHVY